MNVPEVIRWVVIVVCLVIVMCLVVSPVHAASYYVQQGDTVYVGERVDVSGAVGWADDEGNYNLAYFGRSGTEMDPAYIVSLTTKAQRYNYYLDPKIFSQRIGPWYQFYGNGTDDRHGNLLAFNVMPEQKDTGLLEQGQNATALPLQNPNQTPPALPKEPLLPVRHVSDYLIARGDGFTIPVDGPTNIWIFGIREGVYDYHSANNSVEIKKEVIDTLSPGMYTMLLQTHEADAPFGFFVRYNKDTQMIDWFDSDTFNIHHFDTSGQTPENVLQKLETIFPTTHDTFMKFNLEVQNPTISIAQITSLTTLNQTIDFESVGLDNPSYLDVRGYTNVAPDRLIKVAVDPVFNVSYDTTWKNAIVTSAEGTIGGDMREWKVIIPVNKYNMAPGRHFVAAIAETSTAITTADLYLYSSPDDSFVPNKTWRYFSGKYGDEELVPTPTPVIITQVVTQVVTQTILVPVTPSDEQVHTQQKKVQEEINYRNIMNGIAIALSVGCVWYGWSVLKRARLR